MEHTETLLLAWREKKAGKYWVLTVKFQNPGQVDFLPKTKCLFILESCRPEKERERVLLSVGPHPQCPQQPGLNQSLSSSLSQGSRESSYLPHHCWLLRSACIGSCSWKPEASIQPRPLGMRCIDLTCTTRASSGRLRKPLQKC